MPKSTAFIRIKAAVLEIAKSIPAGSVTTFKAVGTYLNVMPRHVAYILANLSDEEKALIPWHRVVSDKGKLDRAKYDMDGTSQADKLASEGILLNDKLEIQNFERLFFAINEESTGVIPLIRYDSPLEDKNSLDN